MTYNNHGRVIVCLEKIVSKPYIFELIDNKRVDIREKLNPKFAPARRRKLKDPKFTIISNNCWGGHVYRYFGVEYLTPTVGLYFFASDYTRFVSNLEYYMGLDLKFIDVNESKHKDMLIKRKQQNCPLGILDDVEIVFLHYKTQEEAYSKWNRRKKRMNWNHLVFKNSEMNQCTMEDLKAFDALPAEPKLCFVSQDYGVKSQVVVKSKTPGNVPDDTTEFRSYVDLVKFINGDKNFKKHQ